MRYIPLLSALVILAFACLEPATAQGYDPNQQYGQGGYQQQPPSYQQFGGLPQTTPNYGYAPDQQQYGGQPQYMPQQGAQYGQPQLQQQYAQYGQMQQPPTYYGQAHENTQGNWPQQQNQVQNNAPQMPAGSFLNDDLPDSSRSPNNTVTENPSGGGKGAAVIKGAAGLLGKVAGGATRVAAPAASLYLMNKAVGGNMRMYVPAPMMPMPGMGYNPYMGAGMRSMMGGW